MENLDKKIITFIHQHHVLTLATSYNNRSQCASCFYIYDNEEQFFIIASDEHTEHAFNMLHNNFVSMNIVLETKNIGKIQGLQIKAKANKIVDNQKYKKQYIDAFPYAKIMNLTLWKLELNYLKYTNNTLGIGKKLIWKK
jgi:uncharacterized protein YhbP (UPF0306 family)